MSEIIGAILIVGVIGLIFGVGLAVAAHFMAVKKDERLDAILKALPGANCGACGYTGCEGYASAVAAGEARTNLCVPGGSETAKVVAGIMGEEAAELQAECAVVRCRGTADVTGKRYQYQGIQTCQAASMLYGGDADCAYGCLGYGDCQRVCPFDAIRVINGVARVDRQRCRGCKLCVAECPKHIIEMMPADAPVAVLCRNHDKGALTRKVCKGGCIACRKCEKECPTQAITVQDNCAVIDYEKCIGCGKCAEVCVTGCIYGQVKEKV